MSVRAPDPPQLDIGAIQGAFATWLRETCPDQAAPGLRLLERLSPDHWPLEWHLPWWLGRAVGLDAGTCDELALGNVQGLASIRLQDDLADGEVPAEEVADARALSAALYEAALRPYRARLGSGSPFWDHLGRCMRDWRSAADDASDLGARGAPLRIAAFAICLLAGDQALETLYPPLERCLDHALDALVRLDQVADWEVDLDAGRWNAFVAEVSPGPQTPDDREHHGRTVLVALLTSDPDAAAFSRIDRELALAIAAAEALPVPVPPLVAHLRAFAQRTTAEGRAFRAHYRELGDEAARWLFDRGPDDRS